MQDVTIGDGFNDDQRERVVEMFWEAFGRKLRPGFVDEVTGRAVLFATLRSDRMIVASRSAEVLGICGYHQDGIGSIDLSWANVKGVISLPSFIRAILVLSIISTSDRAGALVLDGIAVHSAARGQGIGTALLKAASKKAAKAGEGVLRLAVVDSNPKARLLYEREGFREVQAGSIGFLSRVYGFKNYVNMELAL